MAAFPSQDDLSYALDFSGAANFSPFALLAPPDACPASAASGLPCWFPAFDAVVGGSSVPGDTARAVDAGLHAMITAYLTPEYGSGSLESGITALGHVVDTKQLGSPDCAAETECCYLQREEKRGSRRCGPESEISPQEVPGASKGKRKKKKKKEEEEEVEGKASVGETEKKRAAREEPAGYIHVRARRGEATDSHSLAERARREKIRRKMQMLQDLVPGCDKVVGRALLLEEIINYVQSLQSQVEVLSMKLASVEPAMSLDLCWEDFAMQP